MSLMQRLQESDEVLAVVIAAMLSIVIAIVGRVISPRGRVKWAVTHQYSFLTHPNPPSSAPQQPSAPSSAAPQTTQPVLVHTRTIWVQNVGRATVEDIEIIFNYRPHHFEIWPQRQFRETTNPAGNLLISVNGLNPREWITITMLNVGVQLPLVTNVRWKGGVAREAPMAPQEILPRWARGSLGGLVLSGVVFWLYVIVRLILWKVG